MTSTIDFGNQQDFHTEAAKLERAAAAYESVLVKRGRPVRCYVEADGWREDSAAAMTAALKEYGRLSPLTPSFIVDND